MRRIASRRAIACWLVGGTPRDLLLGVTGLDLDLAVAEPPLDLARELALEGFGTLVPLAEEPVRVVRVAGRRTVDLAELAGRTIEEDLARRDFTANAIAIDLETGAWIDPFGGVRDVRQGRLALVAEKNLAEDPLRVFRAARFYATHGLVPDRAVERAARRHAAGLLRVAPERIRVELARLLESDRAAPSFRWAVRAGVLSPALRIPASRSAWSRVAGLIASLDVAGVRRMSAERRRRLRLALIAAGCRLSPGEAAAWLRALRQSREETAAVVSLLTLALSARLARTDSQAWEWVREAAALWPDALLLARSLDPGFRRTSGRIRRRAAGARKPPSVSGGDVIRWLSLAPGPQVGRLLRELEVEGLRGHVRSREEARLWLRNRASDLRAS